MDTIETDENEVVLGADTDVATAAATNGTPDYEATLVIFEEGELVSGEVVRIDNDEVLVDIGFKTEGVIPSNELSIRKSVDPSTEVELGQTVEALVMIKEDPNGRLILSMKRARFEQAWKRVEEAANAEKTITGKVIEVVKGGLIVDLGVRGFLPASLVDIRRVQDLREFMNTEIECKVIELNRSRNNVVLSRRAVLEEERKEVRLQTLDKLEQGDVIEGNISNVVDFGAFVDLDGIDGLIHISEISWKHVDHPSEVLSIGDSVNVKVLEIDRERQRISLGLKQTQEDPWQSVVSKYGVGDELEGKITKVVTFGAFVEVTNGVEGLVHVSELSDQHIENPSDVIDPGVNVRVVVLEIDADRRRLSLSAKRVDGQSLIPEGAGTPKDVSTDEEGSTDGAEQSEAASEEVTESVPEEVPKLELSDEVFSEEVPEDTSAQADSSDSVEEESAISEEPVTETDEQPKAEDEGKESATSEEPVSETEEQAQVEDKGEKSAD